MSFSAYLLGSWENGRIPGISTTLQIINPTTNDLSVIVAFFDKEENPLRLLSSETDRRREGPLSPNEMWEIIVPDKSVDQPPQRPVKGAGVVKIISLAPESKKVKKGLVGFQRHIAAVNIPIPTKPPDPEVAFSEAPLAAVPFEYAEPEYKRILSLSFP